MPPKAARAVAGRPSLLLRKEGLGTRGASFYDPSTGPSLAYQPRGLRTKATTQSKPDGSQHDLVTPVATIHGLLRELEEGLKDGGLGPAKRAAIYRAMEEQFAIFYDAAGDPRRAEETRAAASTGRADQANAGTRSTLAS